MGLGLWHSLPATLLVELALFATGVWLCLQTTRAGDRSPWPMWGLVAFLLLVYAGNLLGEPPPSTAALAWVGHAQWLLVAWGYWAEGRRVLRLDR